MERAVTFEELCDLEPKLTVLHQEATAQQDDRVTPAYCANAIWFGYGDHQGRGIKPRLLRLVGYNREPRHPVLSSSRAYDVAYQTIYNALPSCRGPCGCL